MAVKSSIYFLCRNLNAPAVVPSPAAPTPAMAAVAQACGGSFGGSGADSAPVIRRVWRRQQLPVKVREMKGKVRHKGVHHGAAGSMSRGGRRRSGLCRCAIVMSLCGFIASVRLFEDVCTIPIRRFGGDRFGLIMVRSYDVRIRILYFLRRQGTSAGQNTWERFVTYFSKIH